MAMAVMMVSFIVISLVWIVYVIGVYIYNRIVLRIFVLVYSSEDIFFCVSLYLSLSLSRSLSVLKFECIPIPAESDTIIFLLFPVPVEISCSTSTRRYHENSRARIGSRYARKFFLDISMLLKRISTIRDRRKARVHTPI